MHNTRCIKEDIYYLGASDRRLSRFENLFPLPTGVSYNSYIILGDKTALLDTVDHAVSERFLENLVFALDGRGLDYLIINHMEPDHSTSLLKVLGMYPDVKIVGNKKVFDMISQFFDGDLSDKFMEVTEKDELDLGRHKLKFLFAPMVHWPEVMFTYETTEKILFTADAFGSFGALNGNIFADEIDIEGTYLEDARRYYTNIVGKYGAQVLSALKKAESLDIEMICPLHGPIWRENLGWLLDKYSKWASYEPEKNSVVIFYGSMYGNTENAADIIASKLADKGVKEIQVFDVSKTDLSTLISKAFEYSTFVFASVSYNAELYPPMRNLLDDMKALNLKNRKAALLGNGTWATCAIRIMTQKLEAMKGFELTGTPLEIKSSLKQPNLTQIDNLVTEIYKALG